MLKYNTFSAFIGIKTASYLGNAGPSYIGCGAETVRGFKPKGILQKITLKSRKNLYARPGLYKTFSGIERQQL